LTVAEMLQQSHPDWTFHLVGQDFNDAYAAQLKQRILDVKLDQHVFLYGSRADTAAIIEQATIGLLTSDSEGLPLAILEYGLYGLPVVVTQVGEIPAVVTHQSEGFVVPAGSVEMVYKSLVELIENPNLRLKFGQALQAKINQEYTQESVVNAFLNWSKLL
jgi:glycosyltransferase involved in cell wall biosynthesis